MLPLTINIKDAYANGKDDEQKFIQNLSLFLCTFLKEHGQLVEKKVGLSRTDKCKCNFVIASETLSNPPPNNDNREQ